MDTLQIYNYKDIIPSVVEGLVDNFSGGNPLMAGIVGLEPTNAGIKILCLTAWR